MPDDRTDSFETPSGKYAYFFYVIGPLQLMLMLLHSIAIGAYHAAVVQLDIDTGCRVALNGERAGFEDGLFNVRTTGNTNRCRVG